MKDIEIRTRLLISMQRALLGMIYPSIRAIAVGFNKTEKLKVICYLDREPIEYDYENINDITGEVCSDIEFVKVEEVCVFNLKPFSKLDNLDSWVYIRQEKDTADLLV
ncbi:hypothetical protein QLS71_007985 [Mariniflexile litorale]|uniref:Uncharacterized protein n=1 Tax=Mariniflexile litorale TaxID=3045158 RepID=A0AAU7EKA9_9FLAO|nr:hypothetical protein [Mariniflexile sp. KMM 9835]MDQ8213272.1 hypothetical protein [Mariniflexile sp. KMM 9835]